MPKPSKASLIRRLEALEPGVAKAFAKAITEIRTSAQIDEIARAVEAFDVAAIERLLGIDATALSGLSEAVRAIFADAAIMTLAELPVSIRPRFDMRNARAQQWIDRSSSRMVVEIVESQRAAIRAAIADRVQLGRNPRSIALDIVGRMNPVTRRREGGIVGLTEAQTGYVTRARAELEGLDAAYFGRQRRDKRFDGIVRKAIDSGKPLKAADIDRITGRYADRLLKLRGDTIARTEALNAFSAARDEAFQQAIESGKIRPQHVKKVWDASGDSRTRDSHRQMDGQKVSIGQAFTAPSGAQLMHPGDGSLGAPAAELIQCRCVVRYEVDAIGATLG